MTMQASISNAIKAETDIFSAILFKIETKYITPYTKRLIGMGPASITGWYIKDMNIAAK